MKSLFILLVLSFTLNIGFAEKIIQRNSEYPIGPDSSVTPGSLCDRPTNYRYGERIAYCERNVDTNLKKEIFRVYRDQLHYRLDPNTRSQYKIDHLIPLCAGGSNKQNNLWPQHQTIYNVTDPLEGVGCEQLKAGKITQQALIKLILEAKRSLNKAPDTLRYLNNL
ncbi:MAG: hypothetical protein U0T83_11575 [Bacteriovoracaceae bacterium]